MIGGIRHFHGHDQVYIKDGEHWAWVNESQVPGVDRLKREFESKDFSLTLPPDRPLKRKSKLKIKSHQQDPPPEDILVNEGDDLFMFNVSNFPVDVRGQRRVLDEKPIVSILGHKIFDSALRWDVILEGGERVLVTHSDLRRRNLPLFLEYAKARLFS